MAQKRLTKAEREAIRIKISQGVPYADIALEFGVSKATVTRTKQRNYSLEKAADMRERIASLEAQLAEPEPAAEEPKPSPPVAATAPEDVDPFVVLTTSINSYLETIRNPESTPAERMRAQAGLPQAIKLLPMFAPADEQTDGVVVTPAKLRQAARTCKRLLQGYSDRLRDEGCFWGSGGPPERLVLPGADDNDSGDTNAASGP